MNRNLIAGKLYIVLGGLRPPYESEAKITNRPRFRRSDLSPSVGRSFALLICPTLAICIKRLRCFSWYPGRSLSRCCFLSSRPRANMNLC